MNFSNLKMEINSIVKKKNTAKISVVIQERDDFIRINPNVVKSAASVIKVPIAMACLEEVDKKI